MPASDAALVALLFAVDPHGLGGVIVHAMPGPRRQDWLDAIRRLLPAATPWCRIPLNVGEDRLLGGLDLTATLASGRPVFVAGLLANADGGVVVLSMAERVTTSTAAAIGAALDDGEIRVAREGMTRTLPGRYGVLALDESLDDDERVADALADRLAFYVALDAEDADASAVEAWTAADVAAARTRLPRVTVRRDRLVDLSRLTAAFGVTSMRADILGLRAARTITALRGGRVVSDDDIAVAARLTLPQRARSLPIPDPGDNQAEPQPESAEDSEDASPPSERSEIPDDIVVESVAAAIPPGLLEGLQAGLPRRRRKTGGRGESTSAAQRRGRPVGTRVAETLSGQRLCVLATLKAAAPWQGLRRRPQARAGMLEIRKDDLRVTRFRDRIENTVVFAVDASGSQAAARLAEVKGAVELLLHDCYVRRDQVALVAFRGSSADVLLPATRSLARAKRMLAALPGGGGTPLAAGLEAARDVATAAERQGRVPIVVVLTDGRANVSRDGKSGAEAAGADALAVAKHLAADAYDVILVDTSRRPRQRARSLAEAMRARYVALPQANAAAITSTVRESMA